MKAKKILIVSAGDPEAMGAWPAGYETVSASGDEAAIELAQQEAFEAIVIDGSDSDLHVRKLYALLPILQPDAALFRFRADARTPVQSTVHEHFRRLQNERIKRYIVFNSMPAFNGPELPAFSAN
jgi:hypothetical protein